MSTIGRARAESLNLAGRLLWHGGRFIANRGLWLCGVAGTLDAMADSAGYWNHHAR